MTPRVARRSIARGAAWSVPAVVVTTAAPAMAACSSIYNVVIATNGVGGSDVDLLIRDTKNTNSNTNTSTGGTSPVGNPVVNLTFAVTKDGQALAGASIAVIGDSRKDSEGNFLIGFSNTTVTSGFGESPTQRTAVGTTSATGTFTVKVSTATYNSNDCGTIPATGNFTVKLTIPPCGEVTRTFTYRVYDGPTTVNCP